MKNSEITAFDLDILAEIGNIGAGNAATALSAMLNMPVLLEAPTVSQCNLLNIPECLGDLEDIRTGIFLSVSDSLSGYIMLLLYDEDIKHLSDIIAGGYSGVDPDSVVMETANIITAAYVNAMSIMINSTLNISPPEIGHDMLGSLIDSVLSLILSVADETIIIKTKLTIKNKTISCNYILLLEQESLSKLLGYFKKD